MADWLSEALATQELQSVKPNMPAAGERMNDARRHVKSARLLANDDTTLAMAACHDAIRKSFVAHMSANGLRARSGDGAHKITLKYASNQIPTLRSGDASTRPMIFVRTVP